MFSHLQKLPSHFRGEYVELESAWSFKLNLMIVSRAVQHRPQSEYSMQQTHLLPTKRASRLGSTSAVVYTLGGLRMSGTPHRLPQGHRLVAHCVPFHHDRSHPSCLSVSYRCSMLIAPPRYYATRVYHEFYRRLQGRRTRDKGMILHELRRIKDYYRTPGRCPSVLSFGIHPTHPVTSCGAASHPIMTIVVAIAPCQRAHSRCMAAHKW